MGRKRRERRNRGGSSDVEWIGGVISLPAYVTGEEGPSHRPEALVWVGPEGLVLGTIMARPGEALGKAGESLATTMRQPMCGAPHRPASVRVASEELAGVLRAGHPDLEIVCAPTPELDVVFDSLRGAMGGASDYAPSFLSSGVGPEAVASFFRAAANLFRAVPWKDVPSDLDLFRLSIDDLGVRDVAISVIGQKGESRGVVLFESDDDLGEFVDAVADMDRGEQLEPPPHTSLNFDLATDIPDELLAEIDEYGWEVAAESAYPWVVVVGEDFVARPPMERELAVVEALALALPAVLAEKEAWHEAWADGEPVSRSLSVGTHAGEVEVTLSAPYESRGGSGRPPNGLLADLYDLAQDEGEIDPVERGDLEEELLSRFEDSEESAGLEDLDSTWLVMDFAAEYFGATIATLDPSDLSEIVFEIIPRKVGIDASKAGWIIEVNRAFYAFLQREFELEQADACLRVLGRGAVQKLAAELSDPSNFGMAKSMIMAGREAGYDVDTEEGLQAWMQASRGMPVPPFAGRPTPGALSSPGPRTGDPGRAAGKAKKKKKRKAARKARRRNR